MEEKQMNWMFVSCTLRNWWIQISWMVFGKELKLMSACLSYMQYIIWMFKMYFKKLYEQKFRLYFIIVV